MGKATSRFKIWRGQFKSVKKGGVVLPFLLRISGILRYGRAMPVENHTISQAEDGMRLDKWFAAHYPDVPFSAVQRACRKGEVRVNSGRVKGRERLTFEDRVRVPPFKRNLPPKPEVSDKDKKFIRSLVIYEDEYFFVLNKPAGLATQGGTKTTDHIDKLLEGLPKIGEERPKLVHRLDKETSGVLLIARTKAAAGKLGKLFMSRNMQKVYLAITIGVPEPKEGSIKAALIKKRVGGQDRMVHDESEGQFALTDFRVTDYAHRSAAMVMLFPRTGRQHQLRAHLELIGTPIVGDERYAFDREFYQADMPNGMMLHAYGLVFNHPFMPKKQMVLSAPPAYHFAMAAKLLGLAVPVLDVSSFPQE